MTPAEARKDTSEIYANGCYAVREDASPPSLGDCLFGDLSGRRVVLFGDSHAAQWFDAIVGVAQREGWRVLPVAKAACPPGELPVYNAYYQREYTECAAWRDSAMELIAADAPELVVVSTRAGYYRVMQEGEPLSVARSAPLLGDALTADLRLFAESGAETLLIRDTPVPGFDVPDCVEAGGATACRYPLADSLPDDSHQVHAAEQTSTPVVDLTREVCGDIETCQTVIGGVITFRDDDHLSATFSAALSESVGRAIAAR